MKDSGNPGRNICAVFPPDILEKLRSSGRTAVYEKDSHIFRDKHATENIYILAEGKASVYKMSDNGQKRIIFILDAGSLLNEPTSVNLPMSVNCAAFEKCKVIVVDRNRFLDMMSGDSELTQMVIDQIAHKSRRMYRQLKNASASTRIEKKVAAKLWKLCYDYGTQSGGGTLIDIEITVNDLADLMGVRRETVSRAVKILQDEGLITYKKRRVFVPDTENLSKYFKDL